jgi:DNA helicase-2/ATP-dependent DNA helicase PcrA
MPSDSRIILCAAGGGKTTRIAAAALAHASAKTAVITYTTTNEAEVRRKLYAQVPAIPSRIEVMTWYSFLLREMARPYRSVMHDRRIESFHWVEGRSVPYISEAKTGAHYFASGRYLYSDKASKFVCKCETLTGGAVLRRLAQRFDHIYIDEAQDLAGYDLDLVEQMLKAGIRITLVGDHRQSTFKTNQQFSGFGIVKKFQQWDSEGLAELSYECHTHRCHQHIADLADSLYPNEPVTISRNAVVTGHDGVFVVSPSHVELYISRFSPQILRLDRKTVCQHSPVMNFGESKGLTFDRVLIFPHGLGEKWLKSGELRHIKGSLSKMYVGATRARHSVAFVLDGTANIPRAMVYP